MDAATLGRVTADLVFYLLLALPVLLLVSGVTVAVVATWATHRARR